jgi:hypothetical protein
MSRLFLMLIACTGCRTCGTPVATTDDSSTTDTQDSALDTADTGETGDTAPPPMCAQIEEEPNDHKTEAYEITHTWWSCGAFEDPDENDWDYLTFTIDREGGVSDTWIEIDVDAADRASVADPELIVYGPEGDGFLVEDFNRGTDPYVVFPVSEDGTWDLALYDKYAGNGEDYTWYLRVLEGKQPLEWDHEEVEPNDSLGDPLPTLLDGERAFGVISETYDLDWYQFMPEEGQEYLTLHILANNFGSPLDARLAVYNSAGTKLEAATQGIGDSYDKDPSVSIPLDPAELYYISVRLESDESTQVGGSAYWYVLEVALTDEDETG